MADRKSAVDVRATRSIGMGKGEGGMGSRVYVGNLPFSVDEQQLRTLFEEGGREVLEVKIVTDRDTGRPRGFAFVDMASQEEAQAAINSLNGFEVGGRTLTVNMARERQPRGGGSGRGGFGRGGGGGRWDRY
jgi:RNA recognition motif-containing protein